MILEKDLKKIVSELVNNEISQIALGNSDITIRLFDSASKLSLSTPVYYGHNFIPKSVRSCVSQKKVFPDSPLKTSLSIDEDNFQVFLNYLGHIDSLTEDFRGLLEEFNFLADEWRHFLDEHDKNDLVHIFSKK